MFPQVPTKYPRRSRMNRHVRMTACRSSAVSWWIVAGCWLMVFLVLGELFEPLLVPQRREAVLAIRMGGAGGFVQFDAQAGARGQTKLAAGDQIPAADQFAPPGNVVLREVLLHEHVRRGPAEMQRRAERHRPDGHVRRQENALLPGPRRRSSCPSTTRRSGTDRAGRCRPPAATSTGRTPPACTAARRPRSETAAPP